VSPHEATSAIRRSGKRSSRQIENTTLDGLSGTWGSSRSRAETAPLELCESSTSPEGKRQPYDVVGTDLVTEPERERDCMRRGTQPRRTGGARAPGGWSQISWFASCVRLETGRDETRTTVGPRAESSRWGAGSV
jgi:hypothetical protein